MKQTFSKQASQQAMRVVEGVFGNVVDISLWTLVYVSSMSRPQTRSGQLWNAEVDADRFLEKVNYDSIKTAMFRAKRKGLIKKNRRHAWPEITEAGRSRISAILPSYDTKRIWDKRMHLVTYDVPEKFRHDRNILRAYLKRIGCAKLQDSVWITPYNPIDSISTYVSEKHLHGTIIASNLGHDGSIGEEDLHDLIIRVYELRTLNDRYKAFLKQTYINEHERVIVFLSILKDDQQLPFSLLPSWWKGDEAYTSVKSTLQRLETTMRPQSR
jgi:DNA-binding transcriptional regulator PaaX